MATYLTIGYGDQAGYDRTPQDIRNAAHAHDAEQVRQGAVTGILRNPVQVRNHQDRGVTTSEGSFLAAALPIAGFSLIEAETVEDAIAVASHAPCAVADGVVEVWRVQD